MGRALLRSPWGLCNRATHLTLLHEAAPLKLERLRHVLVLSAELGRNLAVLILDGTISIEENVETLVQMLTGL